LSYVCEIGEIDLNDQKDEFEVIREKNCEIKKKFRVFDIADFRKFFSDFSKNLGSKKKMSEKFLKNNREIFFRFHGISFRRNHLYDE